jgi:hypothetical protein
MAPEDERHTAFRTPIGIYCYKVMPFGLKNAGATYQRAMTKIFDSANADGKTGQVGDHSYRV